MPTFWRSFIRESSNVAKTLITESMGEFSPVHVVSVLTFDTG